MISTKGRIDYIIIWGHGLKYKNEILDVIRQDSNFKIIKILYHQPKSIKKLIKHVYSFDYAPFIHLRAKTRYLVKTPRQVLFIFLKNIGPLEDFLGEGSFRHKESLKLKEIKEKIRNKFNPKNNGLRTENHVIHASDNEAQTNYILKYLGFNNGVKDITNKENIFDIPYYLGNPTIFKIKKISINELVCSVSTSDPSKKMTEIIPLEESPHYQGITTSLDIYQKYIDKYMGYTLTADYYVDKYKNLAKDFNYLDVSYLNNYVIVNKRNKKYLILDGLHRAAILKKQGRKNIEIVQLPWKN